MKILFEDCVRVDQELYFICRDFNVVCSMDIETGSIQIIDSIPEGNVRSWRMGAKIVHWNNYLYFAPMCAEKIWRYDLTNKEWKGYERKTLSNWTKSKDMFQAVLYKDKIYFIGAFYPAIIVLNPATEEMKYITEPYEKRMEIAKEANDCWFRTDYVLRDNMLYMASCVDNKVFKFNMDNYEFEFIEVGSKIMKFSGIDFDGEYYYLSPRKNGPFLVWNGNNTIKEIHNATDDANSKPVFGGVICLDDNVVFTTYFSKESVEISKKDNFATKMIENQYLFYKKIDDDTIVSLNDDGIVESVFKGNRYKYTVNLSEISMANYIKNNMLDEEKNLKELEYESQSMPLSLFVNII